MPQAVLDEAGEIALVVAVGRVRRETAARLGGDYDFPFAVALQLRDQALAAPHAVNIGRVDEVHAAIDGGSERRQGFGVVHAAPGAADRPRPKTDVGHLPARTS